MRKSLFAVALAVILLATNCQKTEIMNPTGTSIGFDSQIGKLTKAADAEGLVTLQEYGFRVWAYRNFEDEFYAGDNVSYPKGMHAIYDGMNALEVTYEAGKWTTTKDYYWPGAQKSLNFFAVSCDETDFSLEPTNVPGTEPVLTEPQTSTVTVQNFAVKGDANNDLMVADLITQAQGDPDNGNVVKPVFRHTLTKVQFNFNTDPETVTEHPVYILNIKTSALKTMGTFVRTYPYQPTTADANAWTLETDELEFTDDNSTVITLPKDTDENGVESEIVVDGEGSEKDRTGLTLTADMKTLDTWLLLPQSIETATVEVTYIIKNRLFTKTFPLYADGLTSWDVNQFVKYNVTIAPNLISFNPSVEEWDTTDVTMNDNGTQVAPNTPVPTPTPTAKTYEVTNSASETVTITINQAGETPAVGETVTDTADGSYTMADGTVIVIADGKVASITAPSTTEGEEGQN